MKHYDVAIIGGGVIGCAVARELSRWQLSAVVLEKEPDVATGNSSRNTGMLHAGFTYKPGSLKAECAVEGNQEFDRVAAELHIPFRRTGKLVVGFTEHDRENILKFKAIGEKNGVKGLRMIDREEMNRIDPNAGGEFAMYAPSSGILDPMQYTIALAENACRNGAQFLLEHRVTAIHREGESYVIETDKEEVAARWVINCAGAYAADISAMLGYPRYYQRGFKGEYYVLDKKAGVQLSIPVYPAPNDKGGFMTHATPTIDGNVLVGPDSYITEGREDYANRREQLAGLVRDGGKMFKQMRAEYFIRNFAGIRWKNCNPETGEVLDFIVESKRECPNTVNLVGIESPGITCALPLARRAVKLLLEGEKAQGREVKANNRFDPVRPRAKRFYEMTIEEKTAAIEANPDYGQIVCRCENVTRAEILEAIHNPLGVHTLTGVKNRTRAMMGRCQGGYCQTRITEMIEQELKVTPEEICYQKADGYVFTGKVRDCE
ncbi:MAG: NAD(P)/FAD-dependent oxidoreductase [Clostridia bacterium]|nr:NAD(P)/FAD-dependent oxidoreductase [Clostridia bacterium]